jgi:hypothetical protein
MSAAAGPNPFSLNKKKPGGPDTPHKSTTYTEDEQKELLNGYVEVPEDLWPLVRYGTHVRYITKEGLFRVGGFVAKNPLDAKKEGKEEKRFVRLQNGFSKGGRGYAEWVVAYEDIKNWYTKPDACTMAVQRSLEKAVVALNGNIRKLVAHSSALEKRIVALEARR